MAGSLRVYVYVDDDGNEYGVKLDEDTGANAVFGFEVYTGSPALDYLPRGAKMRKVNAVQTSGAGAGFRYRSFPCGTNEATAFGGTATTFERGGLTYAVTSTSGEKFKKPVAVNTGLIGQSSTVGQSTGQTGDGGGGT